MSTFKVSIPIGSLGKVDDAKAKSPLTITAHQGKFTQQYSNNEAKRVGASIAALYRTTFTGQWKTLLVSLFTLLMISTICKADTTIGDTTIPAFNNVLQCANSTTRTVADTFVFPADLTVYSKINMHITLNCPTGGCDPWDRFANIQAFHNGEWFEIGRYMTPYGISCGWSIDVTDYRFMLSDTVVLKSFIDTWGNQGWLVNIEFEFVGGTPVNIFAKVENLWVNYHVVYGDTAKKPNLPTLTKMVNVNASRVKLKFVTTGHGQGNTDNAAEFSRKTDTIFVNGIQSFKQLVWRSNCDSTPCRPQNGSWTYNRAGWCPGADVIPDFYDITSKVTLGQSFTLDYKLQEYFNRCSPDNPSCISGSTCPDCKYNNSGHTKPYYAISAQMISYFSSDPYPVKQFSKKQRTQ